MTNLIFLRHGETQWNREKRFQGQLDVGLSESGRRQARQAARRLAREGIDVVYSSDLRRAIETARIVAEALELDVQTAPGLRERHWGCWQGLTIDEVRAQYPEEARQWVQGNADSAPTGGESINQLCDRTTACLMEIVERHPDQTVLIVGHGAALKATTCDLLGLPRTHFGRFRIDNASISMACIGEGRQVLTLMNATAHTRVSEGTETDSS